jgi:hypothetical protein
MNGYGQVKVRGVHLGAVYNQLLEEGQLHSRRSLAGISHYSHVLLFHHFSVWFTASQGLPTLESHSVPNSRLEASDAVVYTNYRHLSCAD